MIKKIILGLGLSASLVFASSNSAQINVNNDTLQLQGEYNLNSAYGLNDDTDYLFTLSYLGSKETLRDNKTDRILEAGFKVMNPYINDYGLSVGFGMSAVWLDNYNKSFVAVPFSMFASYILQENISFNLDASYSPKILSFADSKNYTEANFKANYKVIDNGFVYIGKRYIKSKYDDDVSLKFDDSLYFGFKVLF